MFNIDKSGFSPVVTLDRANTNYKELCKVLKAAREYPVQGKDYDGTTICVSWADKKGFKASPVVYEPGSLETGTKATVYYKDGSTEVSYIKH